jgi:hypothetical protein
MGQVIGSEDLTPYRYQTDRPMVNVGWIGDESQFAVGVTAAELADPLLDICVHNVVHRVRHYRPCSQCGAWPIRASFPNGTHELGDAEIRIEGEDGVVYAAPNEVWHYVVAHDYRPPDGFVAGVVAGRFLTSPDVCRF